MYWALRERTLGTSSNMLCGCYVRERFIGWQVGGDYDALDVSFMVVFYRSIVGVGKCTHGISARIAIKVFSELVESNSGLFNNISIMGSSKEVVQGCGGNDVSLGSLRGFKESLDVCDSYTCEGSQVWGELI